MDKIDNMIRKIGILFYLTNDDKDAIIIKHSGRASEKVKRKASGEAKKKFEKRA